MGKISEFMVGVRMGPYMAIQVSRDRGGICERLAAPVVVGVYVHISVDSI